MLREVETADSLSDGLWGMTGGTQSAAGGKRWQRRQEETQWYYPSITSITSLAPGYQEMEKQHLWFSSTLVCAAFCATLHHDLAVNVLTCAPVTRHASCSILHVPSCQVEYTEYLTFHKYLAWRCRKPRHVYHSGEIQTPYKVPVINCVNDFFSFCTAPLSTPQSTICAVLSHDPPLNFVLKGPCQPAGCCRRRKQSRGGQTCFFTPIPTFDFFFFLFFFFQ